MAAALDEEAVWRTTTRQGGAPSRSTEIRYGGLTIEATEGESELPSVIEVEMHYSKIGDAFKRAEAVGASCSAAGVRVNGDLLLRLND